MRFIAKRVLPFVALIALVLAIACSSTGAGTTYDGTGITSGYGAGGNQQPTPGGGSEHVTPPPSGTSSTTGTTGTTSTTST